MTQNTEKKSTVLVWTLFALLAVIVLTYLGFKYGQAMRGETSDIVMQKKQVEQFEDSKPEYVEELARIDVDPADLERENFNSGYANWTGLKPGMDQSAAEILMQAKMGGDTLDSGASDVRTIYKSNGITAIVGTQTGLADDSIAARQVLAEFEPVSTTANRLVFYGQRHICARGENTTEWTTQLCP